MKKLLLLLLLVPAIALGQSRYVDVEVWQNGTYVGTVEMQAEFKDNYANGYEVAMDRYIQYLEEKETKERAERQRSALNERLKKLGIGPVPSYMGSAALEGYALGRESADRYREQERLNKTVASKDIIVPLKVDLYNYTHIALVDVTLACFGSKQFTDWSTYKVMMKRLENSPLKIINPRKFDKKRWRKDKRFLREIKNPKWLYLYLVQSKEGYDYMERLVLRDSENKLIYNIKTTNLSSSCDASYEAYGVLLNF